LQTKKKKDFLDWSLIVAVVFYGYNTLAKGVSIFNELKNGMNNFRLTKNSMFDSSKINNILSVNPQSILYFMYTYSLWNYK